MLLNNEWVNQEIKEERKKYMETSGNESTIIQNPWDAAKVILRGKFIAMHIYLKKQENSQINNLTLHLNKLGKKNPKIRRKKEIIKIRLEINYIETKENSRTDQ